ncbi:MAG TPA: hypothetical protein VJV78_01220 [Polyangiales bacterium]|nr:hypothetical protein [Polyangiales bacterium]
MSDLQCPAQVWLVAAGQSADVPVPCAGVFVTPALATDAGAAALARAASCPLEVLADAIDAASTARAIDDLADLHRGETFVVVVTREVLHDLTGRAPTQSIIVAIDSEGWRVQTSAEPRKV